MNDPKISVKKVAQFFTPIFRNQQFQMSFFCETNLSIPDWHPQTCIKLSLALGSSTTLQGWPTFKRLNISIIRIVLKDSAISEVGVTNKCMKIFIHEHKNLINNRNDHSMKVMIYDHKQSCYYTIIVDCPIQLICTWVFMTKLKEHNREICQLCIFYNVFHTQGGRSCTGARVAPAEKFGLGQKI